MTEIVPISPPGAALSEIIRFMMAHGASLPDFAVAAILETLPPISHIEITAEALYASLGEITDAPARDAAATLCVQLTQICVEGSLHILGATARGPAMIGACKRRLGAGDQAEADDPELLEQFAAPTGE